MLTAKVQSVNVVVPIPMEDFKRLMTMDFIRVADRLIDAGASKINYEGFYGPNVFFTCDQVDMARCCAALEKLLALKKMLDPKKKAQKV